MVWMLYIALFGLDFAAAERGSGTVSRSLHTHASESRNGGTVVESLLLVGDLPLMLTIIAARNDLPGDRLPLIGPRMV